ncbi:MAG: hypothetical protein ACI87E_003138 [Mariniblastus sp.]
MALRPNRRTQVRRSGWLLFMATDFQLWLAADLNLTRGKVGYFFSPKQ